MRQTAFTVPYLWRKFQIKLDPGYLILRFESNNKLFFLLPQKQTHFE